MISHREYEGPVELRAMQSLSSRLLPTTGFRHAGDLAWNASLEHECRTAVWRSAGEVVAWAWHTDELLAQVDPAYPALADEVLDWARPARVEAGDMEKPMLDALSRRGYVADGGPFMVCLGRPTAGLPPVPELPPGYHVHPADDLDRRAAVHRAAFGSERLTAERYARMIRRWPYRRDADLVVETPTGEYAAYCHGWYDETTGVGELEPVGTHPNHRRLGLAAAVSLATLHAFAAAGATRALVYARGDEAYPAPKALYESLGFSSYAHVRGYIPG